MASPDVEGICEDRFACRRRCRQRHTSKSSEAPRKPCGFSRYQLRKLLTVSAAAAAGMGLASNEYSERTLIMPQRTGRSVLRQRPRLRLVHSAWFTPMGRGQQTSAKSQSSNDASLWSEVTEDLRLLPPLQELASERPSGDEDRFVLPCFPLPLARAALPDMKRTINVREPRYIRMYQEMLQDGKQYFAVPRLHRSEAGVQLAECCVLFQLTDLKDAPAGSKSRYVCKHIVSGRVRICRVLNPEVFAEDSTYLQVECRAITDEDEGANCKLQERVLHDVLGNVASLYEAGGIMLRRYEYQRDSSGRLQLFDFGADPHLSTEMLMQVNAQRQNFWQLATLWQGYSDRRTIALRQRRDRDALAMRRDDSWTPVQAVKAKQASDAQMAELEEDTASLMQRLIQADSHSARLSLLHAAASKELERLAAAAALRNAIGGEY